MTHYDVHVSDGSDPVDSTARELYLVLPTFRALVPLFKNGVEIQPGEFVDLDPNTADAFIARGEVEPV